MAHGLNPYLASTRQLAENEAKLLVRTKRKMFLRFSEVSHVQPQLNLRKQPRALNSANLSSRLSPQQNISMTGRRWGANQGVAGRGYRKSNLLSKCPSFHLTLKINILSCLDSFDLHRSQRQQAHVVYKEITLCSPVTCRTECCSGKLVRI